MRSDRNHSRSAILSPDTKQARGGVIIFVWQSSSVSELSTYSLSLLNRYSDYVGVNIPQLNNFSSLSLLIACAPLIRSSPTDSRTDSFSPSILSSSRNLFILGDFNCHHPLWNSRGTFDLHGEEVFDWIISSGFLPLNDPNIPNLLQRSSGSRSSPDISFAPSSLALFCTWEVLQNPSSDHLPILLSVPLSVFFCTNKCPPSFNFQKDRWDDFALYFDFHCSLSSAAALFTFLTLNAAKSSIFFGRIKRHPKAWWSAEVEAVSERRKAFAAAHRSDRDRQVYISASRQSSSVIAKDKAEAWQETCSSLSPKSTPKFFLSLLPQLFFSQGSASVFADHLRFNISASQAKALRSRARCYLFELLRATCPEQSHLSFCPHFSPPNFLRLPQAFPRPLPLAQTKLPCQGTFLALAWNFFFTFSIFPRFRIPFLPSGRYLLFLSIRWESISTFLLPHGAYLTYLLRVKVF